MNILILGSGGREHAIAWKIAQSPLLSSLYIAPGNAGTGQLGSNVSIDINNFKEVENFVLQNNINMLVVGPEAPLVDGISDFFNNNAQLSEVAVIGPSKAGAMLEGSKDLAKEFMIRNNIPTAAYKTFTSETVDEGIEFISSMKAPYVLKADGLAAGKGVIICKNFDDAVNTLKEMLINKKFGAASSKVVIEEFLKGIELSVFVITDGESYLTLPSAKDYKRIGVGDTGPNTGGMGSISPVPFADDSFMKKVDEQIIKPTIDGLKSENIPYNGFVFFGLMNVAGNPYVIEYNVRMGDPEAESVIPRINNDLIEIFSACAQKTLNKLTIDIDPQYCTAVMLVSEGYPGKYEKGKEILNLDKVEKSIVFHAGSIEDNNGQIFTNGGRVLALTSFANSMQEALNTSFRNAKTVEFKGKYYREDLGNDLLEYIT